MGSIIVCGAGVIGLSTAMMLSRDGHDVTVLEADPHEPPATPAQAWEAWTRTGVAQFHQPHHLLARFRQVCDAELPGLTSSLLAAGCVWVDYLDPLPPTLCDRSPRPGDDALRTITGRRPVVEAVFADAARQERGLRLRRGVKVAGLLPGPSAVPGVPHVAGVATDDGETLAADLVVDATGRRSPAPRWLTALGARPPLTEAVDRGFVYYTRYFTGPARPRRIGRALAQLGTVSLLTLDSDDDTWSVTVFGSSGDTPLKQLRDPAAFTRVVSACPWQAHWLGGLPITDVVAMAGILDRHRRFVVDGEPVATGFAAVGDAWACTNPSAGRGLSIGMAHAQLLRHLTRAHLHEPHVLSRAFDERTEQVVGPFYRNQNATDRARTAEIDALRAGRPAPPADPATGRFLAAAGRDAEVFRALIETVHCLSLPEEVLARPGMAERIERHGAGRPLVVPGPDRAQLLDLLADRRPAAPALIGAGIGARGRR